MGNELSNEGYAATTVSSSNVETNLESNGNSVPDGVQGLGGAGQNGEDKVVVPVDSIPIEGKAQDGFDSTPEIGVTPPSSMPDRGIELREDVEAESNFDEAELIGSFFAMDVTLETDDEVEGTWGGEGEGNTKNDQVEKHQPPQVDVDDGIDGAQSDSKDAAAAEEGGSIKVAGESVVAGSSTEAKLDEENEPEDAKSSSPTPEGMEKSWIKFYAPKDVITGKMIGEGGFGRVLKGFLYTKPVAIKLLHSPIDLKKVQGELRTLLSLKHRCIARIYGVVQQMEVLDCPQVVLQYFAEGNVLQFLSQWENPEDNGTLGKFALDVVEGLEYLRQRGIVHGNLSARNVLIEKLVANNKLFHNAKLSDMGIIRFAEPSGGNYMKIPGTNKIVPIRWVPKEIIEGDEESVNFTVQSDIWSYAVFLWEIWTRGAIPYGASYSNLRVMQFIKDGYSPLKVHCPTECPSEVISVMESIFKVNPKERPTYKELRKHFKLFRGYGIELGPKLKKPDAMKKKSLNKKPPSFGEQAGAAAVLQPPKYAEQPEKGNKKKKKKVAKGKEKLKAPADNPSGGLDNKPRQVAQGAVGGVDLKEKARSSGTTTQRGPSFPPTPSYPSAAPFPGNELHQSSSVNRMGRQALEEVEDSTIANLLIRVNQLENERMARGVGRGSRMNNPRQMWPRRIEPPVLRTRLLNQGSYGEYTEDDQSGADLRTRIGTRRQDTVELPPPPPPYTEDPLPNHSSAQFPTPTPPAAQEVVAGPSHQQYHGYRTGGRGGTGTATVLADGNNRGEDFIRKIRRLAEEIEVLRAEKMTQELLKKSAELADLMNYMTSGGNRSGAIANSSRVMEEHDGDDYNLGGDAYEAAAPTTQFRGYNRSSFENEHIGHNHPYRNYRGRSRVPPRFSGQSETDEYFPEYSEPTLSTQFPTGRARPFSRRGNRSRGGKGYGRLGGGEGDNYGPNYYGGPSGSFGGNAM